MRIRPVLTGLALGLSLAHAPVFALDLNQAYDKALQNDPSWSATQNSYRADKENLGLARGLLLPSIDLSGAVSENEREPKSGSSVDYRSTVWQARATQPLFRVDAWYGYQQARAVDSQVEANYRQQEQELVLRVSTAYFNVLRAQEVLEFSRAEETALGRQLDQAQQRFDVGLIAITDVLEARAQHDGARAGRIAAEASLNSAQENLAVVIGSYEGELKPLLTELQMGRPLPDNAEDWVKLARDKNPQLVSARFNREAAESNTKVNRAAYLPQVNLYAQYQDSDTGKSPQAVFSDGTTTSFGVEAQWNVFGGGQTVTRTRQASYRADAARDQATATERQVVSGTRTAFLNVAANSYQVEARRQAVTSSESALAATQAGYEVGTRNIVDVLLSQRNLYAAKRDYAGARYDYIINSLQLKAASGQLAAVDIKELNGWLDQNPAPKAEVSTPQTVLPAPAPAKPKKK